MESFDEKTAVPQSLPVPDAKPDEELTSDERYEKGMLLFRAGKYGEAFPLLKRVCPVIGIRKNKYPDGQAALAWMYENGRGTEMKDISALNHYKIAARNDNKDGIKGMVRLVVKVDNPIIETCQTALDYASKSEDIELTALIPMLEQKLADAQKWEELKGSLKEFELTAENVETIFKRCLASKETPTEDIRLSILFQRDFGYDEDSTPVAFRKSELVKYKKNILYMLGQLRTVHENAHEITAAKNIYRYDETTWTTETATMMEFYHLAEAVGGIGPFIKKYNRASTMNVKPTLNPNDLDFRAWWTEHKSEWETPGDVENTPADNAPLDILQKYQKQAELGDAEAQYQLGMYYLDRLESATAQGWFEKAAAQQHKEANFVCGIRYGIGGTKNQDKALRYFQVAASAGHNLSKMLIGLMCKKSLFGTRIIGFEKALTELLHQDVELAYDDMSILRENYYNFSSSLREEYDTYRHRQASGKKWGGQ